MNQKVVARCLYVSASFALLFALLPLQTLRAEEEWIDSSQSFSSAGAAVQDEYEKVGADTNWKVDQDDGWVTEEELEVLPDPVAEVVPIVDPAESGVGPLNLGPKKAVLNKADRLRIDRALRVRAQYMAEQQERYKKTLQRSRRGEPELRLCSVSFESYGLMKEVAQMNRAGFPGFSKREAKLVSLVSQRNCDVVAIQGVIGSSEPKIQEALDLLAAKFKEATQLEWRSYRADSNNSLVANAFLVSQRIATVKSFRSFTDYILPTSTEFTLERFHRGPAMIEFLLKGDGALVERRVIVVTFKFNKNISLKRKDLLRERMQMAQAMRDLLVRARGEGENRPIVVAIGDLFSPKYSADNLILSGRLSLADFYRDGKCKLEGSDTFVCKDRPYDQPLLISLVDAQLPEIEQSKLIERDGKQVKVIEEEELTRIKRHQIRRWNYQTGAYMFSEDLGIAYNASLRDSRRLAVTVDNIPTMPVENPFISVELNW